jgi:Flp pilus assembly pilin Flp
MIFKLLSIVHQRSNEERGAVAAEYAVLLALIAVALVGIVGGLTGAITNGFQAAIDVLP